MMADRSSVLTDARARVAKVREDLGFPKQDIWESLTAVQREEWTRLLRIKDNMIATNIKTLAQNLYTSKAQFVFELLQNAEDNRYREARKRGEAPRVSFHVYPHKIVQECNEDGFTDANLKAICAVGQSSKRGNQGYVGEKGIGFKSVFMAAYRVHIQSGGLSFSFEHRASDSGLGMITPEWQDPQDDLEEHLSRITLLLHDEGDAEELAKQRARIREQFAEIQDTILLFLKKLDRIVVVFHDDDKDEAKVTKRITFTINRKETGRRVLTKRTSEGDRTTEDTKYYHITRQSVNGLAGNENRIYTEKEHAARVYATSEITLAFPLTRDNAPVLHDQWVFAFLPVQKTRFKVSGPLIDFLIQADFVTQANRQGIVVDSPRNEGLRCGIADAFITAIKEMCKHPTLRFQWMRYLPKPDDTIDSYWSYLIKKITYAIQDTRLMVPRSSQPSMDTFKLIEESAIIGSRGLDSSGEPLLRDIDPGVYLSPAYEKADLLLLSSFGLQKISTQAIIARAKWDLAQTDSRIKSIEDQDWQSRMAKLLLIPFGSSRLRYQNSKDAIRALALLPLRTGQWRSNLGYQKPVYYPKVADTDLEIPGELDLDVICPSSITNEDRKKLFDSIGVTRVSVTYVRNALTKFYQSSFRLRISQSVYHIHFLYLTHHRATQSSDYASIAIMSDKSQFKIPKLYDNIYLRDENPYGPGQLLEPTPAGDLFGNGSPGLEVIYIHGDYLEHAPSPSEDDMESFKDWLHRHFNVRRYIPIADAQGKNLSDACRYIAAHRPERFMGFLKENWTNESHRFDRDSNTLQELGKISVLCERGDKTGVFALENTYLPLDTIRGLCDRFLRKDEMFPFLRLETPVSDETLPLEWIGLDKIFHLGIKELDLVDFALDILKTIQSCNDNAASLDTPKRVLDLYIFLQGKVLESGNQEETQDKIRSYFENEIYTIYVPQYGSRFARWADPYQCVWQAPNGASTIAMNSLSHLYSHHFRSEAGQLDSFFLETLGIQREFDLSDVVWEIEKIKSVGNIDLDVVHKLYKFLYSTQLSPASRRCTREDFEDKKLVYGGEEGKWYTTKECLWSSPTRIRDMLVVQPLYEDLEDFFVNVLGVETQTTKMVYEKLTAEETTRLPMEEIKDTILAFSSLLESEGSVYDPEPVLQNKIFPVRLPGSGGRVLQNGKEGFAIWDRKPLGEAFSGQGKFLDFSMDLVRDLESFIGWAGLGNRYLSKAVKDFTAVDSSSTRVVTSPRLRVQSKAHALTRIAVTYNSPRVGSAHDEEALYRYLRESKTLETNKITSELHLHQDGRVLKVEKEAALLHIREDDSGLKIYIPEDEIDQETCFRSKLPQRLCEWLMTDPATQISNPVPTRAVMAVQGVLGARHRSLRAILDEQGILDINLVDEDDDGGDSLPNETASQTSRGGTHDVQNGAISPSRTLTSESDATGAATPSSSHPRRSRSSSRDSRETEAHSASHGRVSGSRAPALPTPIPILVQPSLGEYTRLLTLTVAQAREAAFPSPAGSLNIPVRLQQDVIAGGPYDLHAFGKWERDRMVGAAGELFVFELLSRIRMPSLPGFNIDNWKSTIRHYAASHPEYGDIRRFTGPETSDITYDDTDGIFTNLLVANGYMPAHISARERIGYSIEVKTTTDACEAPFYMSNSQYLMMQRQSIQNASQQSLDRIYLIFRVYNIGRSSIGLRILVDPEHLKQTGTLEFTASTWSVIIRD
ncbi:hypothetical protein PGQ11_005802 [Apiospora arundinis]|uniref:Protein NO VEIN C-terminal domain-containing protein n=1 Tax=Apiospora arundinis TaxID=335852 RepID=A0ABR2JCY0_9PEZI